jgi:hypothetical protein
MVRHWIFVFPIFLSTSFLLAVPQALSIKMQNEKITCTVNQMDQKGPPGFTVSCDSQEPLSLVSFEARMPAHKHGMTTTPTITPKTQNSWSVTPAKLHMPGKWRFELKIQLKNEIFDLVSEEFTV